MPAFGPFSNNIRDLAVMPREDEFKSPGNVAAQPGGIAIGYPFGGSPFSGPMNLAQREMTSREKADEEEKQASRCREMLNLFLQRPTHEMIRETTYIMERYIAHWTNGRVRVL